MEDPLFNKQAGRLYHKMDLGTCQQKDGGINNKHNG